MLQEAIAGTFYFRFRRYTSLMQSHHSFLLIVPALLIAAGCVSQSKYDKLQDEHAALEKSSQEQADRLKEQDARLVEQTSVINGLQGKIGKATTRSAELDRSLAETKQALNDLAQRKAEMEKELKEFQNVTNGLKAMIDTGNVKVRFEKGRMVVSLGSDVLFSSGSAKLSSDGIEAVKAVTQQLAQIQGKDFQIEGHTDNVPIKTRDFPSNWHLASARALTVVNTMIGAGMPAERLSAASFAETRPAASNDSPATRAQNRRIDIVVVPDLSKLMDVDALARQATPTPNTRQPANEKITQ